MRIHHVLASVGTVCALALGSIATIGPATILFAADDANTATDSFDHVDRGTPTRHIRLNIPSPTLQQCLPRADVNVDIKLTGEQKGFDIFDMTARHIAPNREYTVFLMEQANPPFGAVEYIGELRTDRQGNGHAEYHLIVDEAFASSVVNGQRTHIDLHEIGVWFADPKDDDFCFGPGGFVSPFDGDGEAGGLLVSSATPTPLPAIAQ